MGALMGSIYYLNSNLLLSVGLAILFVAQLITVVSAKCIILYFLGGCTIGTNEKHALDKKGIAHQ
jgi:hypothetical protein